MQLSPTTITQKGQVTIPAPVRRLMRVKPGDQVEFVVEKNKEITVKPAKRFDIMSLYGSLKPKVKFKATDDIYTIIKREEQAWPEAAAERDARTLREHHTEA